MAKDVKDNIKGFHSLMIRAHLLRKLYQKSVIFIADSNSELATGNKTKDAHFHGRLLNCAIDGMHLAVFTCQ
jgi:hypothetical protein